jgi:hypothetical protein
VAVQASAGVEDVAIVDKAMATFYTQLHELSLAQFSPAFREAFERDYVAVLMVRPQKPPFC